MLEFYQVSKNSLKAKQTRHPENTEKKIMIDFKMWMTVQAFSNFSHLKNICFHKSQKVETVVKDPVNYNLPMVKYPDR